MERLTKRFDGWVMREGCHGPCRTCNGAKCADIFPMIDRLAAYEDTMPIERVQELAQAEKDGRLVVLPPNDPLTLDELRAMIGSMVQCGSVDGQFFGRMLVGMNGCVICDSFDFSDYGKTWLAYRRKPEEGRT